MADRADTLLKIQQHEEVTMRMIGHQVLLAAGDDSSLVKPIEKTGDRYRIAFESEFAFSADTLAMVVDSIMTVSKISGNYIVEAVSCTTGEVVYGYELNGISDLRACGGRSYPVGCYELMITLLDTAVVLASDEAESPDSAWILWVAAIFIQLVVVILFLRKRKSQTKGDPYRIEIGRFVFDRRNMELTIEDSRIELTSKEAELLHLLRASANDTVEREQILKEIWQDDGDYVGRTLDVFVSKLRKKLEADSNVKIINIRGVGYKLILND